MNPGYCLNKIFLGMVAAFLLLPWNFSIALNYTPLPEVSLLSSEDSSGTDRETLMGKSSPNALIIKDSLLSGKKIYVTKKLTLRAPEIDGLLNDECWLEEGSWGGNFRQREPKGGERETERTEFKILYDESNIYVAIRAFDREPKKIERLVARRDNFSGDIAGVAFDSYFDRRTAFEFDLTAAGSKLDAVPLDNGRSWDMNWDPVWSGKTSVEDSAWTAEMKIPLSQIRFAEKDEQVWGLHVWRWINRLQEEDNWQYVPLDAPGMVHLYGELHGIKGIKPHRQIEFLPYTVAKMERSQKESGNPFKTGSSGSASLGLDGKVGVTGDLTLDFTVNPDFGQVEADPSVMNLTAFEVFQSEKRPFFIEGGSILDFQFDSDKLFYSRRIGQQSRYTPSLLNDEYAKTPENTAILSAFKLTGKTRSGLSIGVVQSITANEYAEVRSPRGNYEKTVEPLTSYFTGRLLKEYDQGNTMIGGVITAANRNIKDNHLKFLADAAYSGGVDFTHQWNDKTYYVSGKAVFSNIRGSERAITMIQTAPAHYFQRPDADYVNVDSTLEALSGYGGSLEIGKGGNGNWRFTGFLSFRTPGLELNDMGFMSMADIITQDLSVTYVENKPGRLFRNYSLLLEYFDQQNFGGERFNAGIYNKIAAQFNGNWGFTIHNTRNFRVKDPRILRGGPSLLTDGWFDHSINLYSDKGAKFQQDFTFHKHFYDDNVSNRYDFIEGTTWRIGNAVKLRLQSSYRHEVNNLQYLAKDMDNGKTDYYMAKLTGRTYEVTFRLDYSITPELTLQLYASPYIYIGRFNDFKKITNPKAESYSDRFHSFTAEELTYDPQQETYSFRKTNSAFALSNPDFTFRQFRSNLVLRWEYSAGSTAYLVWSQGRTGYERFGTFDFDSNVRDLTHIYPDNIFLIKVNHWISI